MALCVTLHLVREYAMDRYSGPRWFSWVTGVPLLWLSAVKGMSFPQETMDSMNLALPSTLYPSYGVPLVVGTTLLVLITVTIVSFLPTRRISKLKPTDALRGKMA